MHKLKQGLAALLSVALVALGFVALANPASATVKPDETNYNSTTYWEGVYPGTTCTKVDDDWPFSPYGSVTDRNKAVTLKAKASGATALIVKGGSVDNGSGPGNVVYSNPVAGRPYFAPLNKGGQQADVSHWIICMPNTPSFDPNWQYPAPTCDGLTVTYPTDIPAGQANDVNIKVKNLATSEVKTFNFHNGTGTWSGAQTFNVTARTDWPGWTWFQYQWVQVAGTNYHWEGSVTCGTQPPAQPALDATAGVTVSAAACDAPGVPNFTIANATWTTPADRTAGEHTRTAQANDGHAFADGPTGGSPTKTVTYTIGKQLDCATPVTPVVTPQVCTPAGAGQTLTGGTISLPTTEHVSYSAPAGTTNLAPGKYTVTATAANGYALSNLPDGWTSTSSTTATITLTISPADRCAVQPPAVVEHGQWVDGAKDCTAQTVTQTRTVTTWTYTWDDQTQSYVKGEPSVATDSTTNTRPMTPQERLACVPVVTPVAPDYTPITQCGTYGSITLPTTPGVQYTLIGNGTQGHNFVTATPEKGYRFDGLLQVKVWEINLGFHYPCAVVVSPIEVTQPVCTPTDTDQEITPGAVTEPSTPHITYTISGGAWSNLTPGTYTVTAKADHGFVLDHPLPSGWHRHLNGTATYQVTIIKPADCAPAPAWVTTTLAVTQPVCTPTDTSQTVTPGAIEHPWNDGVDYTITGGSWTDLVPGTYTVTATARDGWYLMNQPDGWTPQDDGSLTYPVTIIKPADCAPAPVTIVWPTVTGPTCTAAGALPALPQQDGVTFTWNAEFNGPGTYTMTATAQDGFFLAGDGDSKVRTQDFTVAGAIGNQGTNSEAPCYVAPPEPTVTTSAVAAADCSYLVTTVTTTVTTNPVWNATTGAWDWAEPVTTTATTTTQHTAATLPTGVAAPTGCSAVLAEGTPPTYTSQVLAEGTPPTYTSQVLAAGTPPTGAGALASTGADVAPYALATLLTLLAGTGLLLLKRRSDSSDTQDAQS